MYPNLSDQTQFRLKILMKSNMFLSQRLEKENQRVKEFVNILLLLIILINPELFYMQQGVFIVSFASVIVVPTGTASASFSFAFSITIGIVKKLIKTI